MSCFPLPRSQGQGAGILRDNCRTGSGSNNETMSLQGCIKLQSCSVIHNTQLVWILNSFSKSGINSYKPHKTHESKNQTPQFRVAHMAPNTGIAFLS